MIYIWDKDDGKDGRLIGDGDTLTDAIRDAGGRCETCEHWDQKTHVCKRLTYKFCQWPNVANTAPDFFCPHHSNLQDEESK